MLKSPKMMARSLPEIFSRTLLRALLKLSISRWGCLYIPPKIIFWLPILKLSHLFSTRHLEPTNLFFRLNLSSKSISVTSLKLLFFRSRATPPLAMVGLSIKISKSGNSFWINPIVENLISVRHIILNLNLRH